MSEKTSPINYPSKIPYIWNVSILRPIYQMKIHPQTASKVCFACLQNCCLYRSSCITCLELSYYHKTLSSKWSKWCPPRLFEGLANQVFKEMKRHQRRVECCPVPMTVLCTLPYLGYKSHSTGMCKSVQKRLNEIYTLDRRKELITVTCPLQRSLICRHKHKMTTQDLSQ